MKTFLKVLFNFLGFVLFSIVTSIALWKFLEAADWRTALQWAVGGLLYLAVAVIFGVNLAKVK